MSSLGGSVTTQETRVASMTPDQKKEYYEGKTRTEPGNARWPLLLAQEEARTGNTRAALRWSEKALEVDSDLVEARVLRLAVYTARKDYGRAAGELAKMPSQALFDYPAVNADAFVIYTRAKEFDRADVLFDRIPVELASRADVSEAMTLFRQHESSRLEEQAMTELPEEDVRQDNPTPEAAPVKSSEEPVDARINAPRGSFTSPTDPVAEALAHVETPDRGKPCGRCAAGSQRCLAP